MEVAGVALWDWNIATGAVHWSNEHFRQQGYALGEVTPSYEAWLKRIHPEDVAEAEARVAEARDRREDYRHEFRVVHADGSVRWLSARGRFFYDAEDRPIRMIGAVIDVSERRQSQERQAILIRELQHRTLNLVAGLKALAEKSLRGFTTLAELREGFLKRLDALARAQTLLSTKCDAGRITFDQLLDNELLAMGESAACVDLQGPRNVALRTSSVQLLAMAIHAPATNALKHGALRPSGGRLVIAWRLEWEADRPGLKIDWRETGVGRIAAAPPNLGQGSELLLKALPYQLGARTGFALEEDGIHCTIEVPLAGGEKTG